MKVTFRRQVYSNSSTGLEKSAQVGKEVFTFKKSFLEDGVNYSVTRGQGIFRPVSLWNDETRDKKVQDVS